MDMFKGIRNVIAPVSTENIGIDQIVSRLQQSSLPEARHNACEQIYKLAKTQQLELGVRAIPVLIELLRDNRSDLDFLALIVSALDSLVTNYTEGTENVEFHMYGTINSEVVVQESETIELLIGVLDESDMYVRLNTVKLLTHLAENKRDEVQDAIMRIPTSLSRLVDVLSDKREAVCNEGLLCIKALAQNKDELCKILVFEGVLETLLDIVEREGGVSGSIVVEDCLELVCLLIREPFSQNYFRETSCYQRLPTLLKVPDAVALATTAPGPLGQGTRIGNQITKNLTLALRMVQLMVSSSSDDLTLNQSAMFKSGAFSMVGDLALGPQKAPRTPPIRGEALKTMAFLIRQNQSLQDALAGATVPNDDGTSGVQGALNRVLRLAIYSKEQTISQSAALCFLAYLYKNPDSQVAVASTIVPVETNGGLSVSSPAELSAGQMLVQAILQWEDMGLEPIQVYTSCAILCGVLQDNEKAKSILLNIPIEVTGNGSGKNEFLNRISKCWFQISRQGGHLLIRIGLMKVLIYLLDNYTPATSLFLASSSHLPYIVDLVAQESTNKNVRGFAALLLGVCLYSTAAASKSGGSGGSEAQLDSGGLLEVIRQRIGVDGLNLQLDTVKDSPQFVSTADMEDKGRWCTGDCADGETSDDTSMLLLFNGGFVDFFNKCYDLIQRKILALYAMPKRTFVTEKSDHGTVSSNSHESYTTLIESQDEELTALRQQVFEMRKKISDCSAELSAQHLKSSTQANDIDYLVKQAVREKEAEVDFFKNKVASLNEWIEERDKENAELKKTLATALKEEDAVQLKEELKRAESEVKVLSDAYNDAEGLLHEREEEYTRLKGQLEELKSHSGSGINESQLEAENDRLKSELLLLKERNSKTSAVEEKMNKIVKELEEERKNGVEMKKNIAGLESELEAEKEKLVEMQAEQNELLLCLAEVTEGQGDTESEDTDDDAA